MDPSSEWQYMVEVWVSFTHLPWILWLSSSLRITFTAVILSWDQDCHFSPSFWSLIFLSKSHLPSSLKGECQAAVNNRRLQCTFTSSWWHVHLWWSLKTAHVHTVLSPFSCHQPWAAAEHPKPVLTFQTNVSFILMFFLTKATKLLIISGQVKKAQKK